MAGSFDAYMQGKTQYEAAQEHTRDQEFRRELSALLNKYSKENSSGTPDFLLAEFLAEQLQIWNLYVNRRGNWRGESVELPALQKLRDKKHTVPATVYLDGERHNIGTAEVTITDDNILWGLISEVSAVVEEGRTTQDLVGHPVLFETPTEAEGTNAAE